MPDKETKTRIYHSGNSGGRQDCEDILLVAMVMLSFDYIYYKKASMHLRSLKLIQYARQRNQDPNVLQR